MSVESSNSYISNHQTNNSYIENNFTNQNHTEENYTEVNPNDFESSHSVLVSEYNMESNIESEMGLNNHFTEQSKTNNLSNNYTNNMSNNYSNNNSNNYSNNMSNNSSNNHTNNSYVSNDSIRQYQIKKIDGFDSENIKY